MDITIERLLSTINDRGISQRQFALAIGCTPSLVSDWKSGKVSSFPKYLKNITDYLDISADYLLGKTPFPKGEEWEPLIKQYQLAEDNVQELVRRLLGLENAPEGRVAAVSESKEENMSAIIELITMFDDLSLVGKSRVIAVAADEVEKFQSK